MRLKTAAMNNKPLVSLKKITVRVRDRFLLEGTSWKIGKGENWAVLGPNGAGKSSLVRALMEDVPVVRGSVVRHDRAIRSAIGYVSFELHERLISWEEEKDHARYFSGNPEGFETALETILSGPSRIPEAAVLDRAAGLLGIRHLLDRGIRFLSTGEMRKVLLARALVSSPRLLILDEPFGGLDAPSRRQFEEGIRRLIREGLQIILVTNRMEEIPAAVSHVLCLKDGRVLCRGRKEDVLDRETLERLFGRARPASFSTSKNRNTGAVRTRGETEILVDLRNVTVRYDDVVVLRGLNWTMRRGENWAILGPNGSGKTTLLGLISGDNAQAYANEIRLFGRRKGSGESVWEIKSRIGIVSSEGQVRYRRSIPVRDVVASGFFDSVGLYRDPGPKRRRQAREWMERLDIQHLADRIFDRLSYGERRKVLLARAMVKSPLLLILDEPCEGLDPSSRSGLLSLIDRIGREGWSHLIYVTHYEDEIPPSIGRILILKRNGTVSCGRPGGPVNRERNRS